MTENNPRLLRGPKMERDRRYVKMQCEGKRSNEKRMKATKESTRGGRAS